jgi:hypothetical protein
VGLADVPQVILPFKITLPSSSTWKLGELAVPPIEMVPPLILPVISAFLAYNLPLPVTRKLA